MGSNCDLLKLLGKAWDAWEPEKGLSQSADSRREALHFHTPHDNNVELGTLPKSLMPLFGSYPVDDVFSLVTCPTCKFRFRTQTADHHVRKCQKKKKRESPSVSSLVEKVAKVPSVVVKTKPVTNPTASKTDLFNNNITERVSTPSPKVASPNLVPPLVIKIEHAIDAATEPTYTAQAVKPFMESGSTNGNNNIVPDYFPPPLDQSVAKPLRLQPLQENVIPKKVQETREKKLIPLKDRRFNPDEHCGVTIEPDARPCTRSLTCKTHSISLKRSVPGRTNDFDLLLAAYKKSRDKTKLEENKCINTPQNTNFAQPDPFEGIPAPSPATVSRTNSVTRREPLQIESTRNLEVIEFPKHNFDRSSRKYIGSEKTRLPLVPLASLKIDSHLGSEQKVVSFGNPISDTLALGFDDCSNLFLNQYQTNQTEDVQKKSVPLSDVFEDLDDYFKSLALEKVKVPRPVSNLSKKIEKIANTEALELFRKGELSQLELLEQGILMSKSSHTTDTEKSPKKTTPNLKRKHSSPSKSPVDANKLAKQTTLGQNALNASNRSPISFKVSPSQKANQSNVLVNQGLNMTLSKPSLQKASDCDNLTGNVQVIGAKDQVSYRNPLLLQPQPNTKFVSNLIERIPTALRLPVGRNENHSMPHSEALQVVKSRVVRNINLNKSETHSSGAPRPAWTKHNTKELGAGQRSPHDGPVSDSELKKLLDSQFEDLDP